MKCDVCGKRDATVHVTEVVNETVTKLHLCEPCAKSKSEEMNSHFGLTDLLSGLMDFGSPVPGKEGGASTETRCAICGMTYYDFQKSGRLGCGRCYETFDRNLSELLRKIHGSDKHVGKIPLIGEDPHEVYEDLQRLKNELNQLVNNEEFEKAAILRDRIKKLEEKLNDKI